MTTQLSAESLSIVAHNGVPVITTELMASLYCTERQRITNNFNRNKERFTEGKHYYKLTNEELRSFKHGNSLRVSANIRAIILWTQRGAARHAKMLETDQAWDVFEKLEDYYFSQREQAEAEVAKLPKPRKSSTDERTPLRQYVEKLISDKTGLGYEGIWKLVHARFDVDHINQLTAAESLEAVAYLKTLEGEFLGKQKALPVPALDINLPLQWWIDNNPTVRHGNRENIEKSKQCLPFYTPSLDVTLNMLVGDNNTSPAIQLINVLESAGFNVAAPKAEIVAMRKHLANMESNMRAIIEACQRVGSKKLIFRGGNADIVIN
ncbi:ORF6N domain-containing protein [Brenneria populi subsp. brevivirga]|uniref:ORF6N domain-containing protein n=1 Tax=Brenneria populi TaxID=1505588 RepID=UPI002E171382|nr:ORF6N domain-containing protein [Brenneria populi subsp. brevivirga]